MSKHTPGPWRVVPQGENESIVFVEADTPRKNGFICDLDWWDSDIPEMTANTMADAHLIAAAPDMLAMLCLLGEVVKSVEAAYDINVNVDIEADVDGEKLVRKVRVLDRIEAVVKAAEGES